MAGTSATAAAWLAPFVLPICFAVAWSDLRAMRIPNVSVVALVAVFAVGGALLFPLDDYLWRWTHLVVMLVLGIVLNALGQMGAGDAKFIAAAAPFVALSDAGAMLMLLAGCLLAGYAAHRIARATALRRLAPDWQSWSTGRRFPMGFPLGTALSLYLLGVAAGLDFS